MACKNEPVVFKPVSAEQTNILFENTITETKDVSILDYLYFYNGGGVAIGDINNDNLPDIFLSGNQVKNKLYLNKGNLEFEDITLKAGVEGKSTWNTGAIMGDVNGDGLLDIYVCAVVGINGFYGHNELYINNGDETFNEKAAEYQLDFDSFSATATFLDYDLDGDLDIFLLNHAIHTPDSFGNVALRNNRNPQTGDKLLRNDNGLFTDVSDEAGIYGGDNGYGLGVSIADFNQDGYPDIYVGNDFHEDDYYYVNNGDGTFSNKLTTYFGHTSRFSMGSDVADINHDGLPDLLTLDMLPENETTLKSSVGDEDYQTQKIRVNNYGYYYQYSRNMLQINQADGNFKEVGILSGLAATDWSWSALFADYNQDGEQDVFITNGILRRPNDLDYINFVSDEHVVKKISKTNLVDKEALSKMPNGFVENYIFKGTKNMTFKNTSNSWIQNNKPSASTSVAMGDLDNDGDIDLVVNNINEKATILENQTNTTANYLKIKFQYTAPNTLGIGTKITVYAEGKAQFKELYTCRGFQSSSEPIIHFGFQKATMIDSVKVVWPNNKVQVLTNVKTNQFLTIAPEKGLKSEKITPKKKPLFQKTTTNLGIDFIHQEDNYTDFLRQKLIPYMTSNKGPAVAIGDLNNDGKEDLFFGGSKFISSKIYLQQDTTYVPFQYLSISKDSIKENISAVIADFNNDSKNDLFIASGGGDFYGKSFALTDSYFIQKDTIFIEQKLPTYFENASVVKSFDYDGDGDLDLFVGNYTTTNDFGNIPPSFLLQNNQGIFEILTPNPFEKAGMIRDAVWDDFDNDGLVDLILVGEWMSPKFYKNTNKNFKEILLAENLFGLWQSIQPFDIDNDGDTDYLLGNWGTNTKFKASKDFPLKMYYGDFDANGSSETVVCIEKNKQYYPIAGLDELSSQLEFLKKKFTSYAAFAGVPITELFDKKTLAKTTIFEVNQLQSGYLENNNGSFSFVPFSNELQVSPLTTFLKYQFKKDSKASVLVGGNYFGVTPYHGRFDSFSGAIISDKNTIELGAEIGLDFTKKEIKTMQIIHIKNQPYLLVVANNAKTTVYKILN